MKERELTVLDIDGDMLAPGEYRSYLPVDVFCAPSPCSVLSSPAGTHWTGRVPAGTSVGSPVNVAFYADGVASELFSRSNTPCIVIQRRRSASRLVLERTDAEAGIVSGFCGVAFSADMTGTPEYTRQHIDGFGPTVPVGLAQKNSYLPGGGISFRLHDEGLNHLPDIAEAVFITLYGANGDHEVFRLKAAVPASGFFNGYVLAVDAQDANRR